MKVISGSSRVAPISPLPVARSVSVGMRSFSSSENVRRLGRSDNFGFVAAGAVTTVGLRPTSVPAPAATGRATTLLGMTTRLFSCALKGNLPGRRCLVIVGTEGVAPINGNLLPELFEVFEARTCEFVNACPSRRVGSVKAAFKRTAVRAGTPWAHPHPLRQTAATWMIETGTSLRRSRSSPRGRRGNGRAALRQTQPGLSAENGGSPSRGACE